MFSKAKWIWCKNQASKNERVSFFFDIDISRIPKKAEVKIGSETKYYLFVNGELAVFDGGLFRESANGCGYFDTVDVAKFLKQGKNLIVVHVWYYGNGGRNNSKCEKGGVIVESEALEIFSRDGIPCRLESAYYTTAERTPSYLYGGDNTAYDSRIRPFSLCPEMTDTVGATVVAEYGDAPFGKLLPRPVPLFFFTERVACDYTETDGYYTVKLDCAKHFSPYFKVKAENGTVIEAFSDRYEVNGGPGDFNSYRGHRAEYICHDGEQEFEMLDWIFGEKIYFTVKGKAQILELGYRESGYDSLVKTDFECDDPLVNRLFEKCVTTLRVCMRENYMDCPDRERGQWIGDVSVQAPQVIYLLDENGLMLLKKSITDFITLRKGDVLFGNVPGDNCSELPSQSLNAISEIGMIAAYYEATREKDILRLAFEPAVRYLMLFETDADGVVLPRKGNWEWYDHLYNCDKPILNICWYYSALRFAEKMANELDDHSFDGFLGERKAAIEAVFEKRYWNEKMHCYASGGFADDRANAMVVLSGLCPEKHYENIRYLLTSVFNSSTYMENYVLTALCEMGYKSDAFKRMMSRYYNLATNENSTLWEDFYHLGTKNHAWSGAPATVLLRYFAGINSDLTVSETEIAPLKYLKCTFTDKNGKTRTIEK